MYPRVYRNTSTIEARLVVECEPETTPDMRVWGSRHGVNRCTECIRVSTKQKHHHTTTDKRKFGNPTMASSEKSQMEKLPDELVERVFAACGPIATARCAEVCKRLQSQSKNNPNLWHNFAAKEVRGCEGDDEARDWKAIYGYLYTKQRQFNFSLDHPLPGRPLFADDGGRHEWSGGPPAVTLSHGENQPYSTGNGVTRNVDFVVDLGDVCLITGFAAANHCRGCSGPLKEALVFTSLNPPDLDHARIYDGKHGSEWVNMLEKGTTETKAAYRNINKLNRERTVSFTANNDTQPVAGLRLPEYPDCYEERVIRHCKPTVGRYVHFKLLGIYNPRGRPESQNNIDVMDLLTFGVALPELPGLLHGNFLRNPERPIPDYQRIHELQEQHEQEEDSDDYDSDGSSDSSNSDVFLFRPRP